MKKNLPAAVTLALAAVLIVIGVAQQQPAQVLA